MSRTKWTMFVVGNLISTATVITEIATLRVCFDEYVGELDDDGIGSVELEEQKEADSSNIHTLVWLTLVFGLLVDVLSAFALSGIYDSPLDIKSVHKIPPGDMRDCEGSVIVNFLPPFSWAFIYMFGGTASISFSNYSLCGGQGGSAVEAYLRASGAIMIAVGMVMLGLSALMLPFSCGSPMDRTDRCCAACRVRFHKRVLSKGPYVDIVWQLQGSIWAYRAGAFGLPVAVIVGMSGIFGEVLAALGSVAPDVVEVIVGPLRDFP